MADTGSSSKRITCLDGIRGVSILLVLLAHTSGTENFSFSPEVHRLLNMGHLGVRVFFVISGFLITSILIHEHVKTGRVSLLKFYLNRTFRIFPAFYFYLGVVVVLFSLGVFQLERGDLLHALTYTVNYHHQRAWQVGHLWSLAVEEQFYFLWPLVFLLWGRRGALFCAVGFICMGPVIRIVTWNLFPELRVGIGESFETVADAIAAGCLLAFIRHRFESLPLFTALSQRTWPVYCLVVLVLFLNYMSRSITVMYPIGETVMNVSIALSVDWCLRNHQSSLGRFLSWRPLVWIGTMSYSLYLWQQIFLNRTGGLVINVTPLNLALAFALAALSYYLVESPVLRVRDRFFAKYFGKGTEVAPAAPHALNPVQPVVETP